MEQETKTNETEATLDNIRRKIYRFLAFRKRSLSQIRNKFKEIKDVTSIVDGLIKDEWICVENGKYYLSDVNYDRRLKRLPNGIIEETTFDRSPAGAIAHIKYYMGKTRSR